MNRQGRLIFLSAILSLAGIAAAPRYSHAQTIINIPANGQVATAADMGESITAPTNSDIQLDSFQVYGFGSGGNIQFEALLYQFNPSSATTVGAPLYTSSLQIASGSFPPTVQTFTFNTGGIILTPGGHYLLDLHQEGYQNGGNLQMNSSSTIDSGGGFLAYSDFLGSWVHPGNPNSPPQSLAFQAVFNAPEPTSLSCLTLGAGFLLRRRNRQPVA